MKCRHLRRFTIRGLLFLVPAVILPGCDRSSAGGYHEIAETVPDEALDAANVNSGAVPVEVATDEVAPTPQVKLLIKDKQFRVKGPQDSLRITYDDFDLLKILSMDPVPTNALEHFPKWLSDLEGRRVCVRGFMYPPFQESDISSFVLARDNQICCFGDQNAKPYDLVVIVMREGVTTDYMVDRPFDVIGTFHIDPIMRNDDVFYSLYRIKDATIADR